MARTLYRGNGHDDAAEPHVGHREQSGEREYDGVQARPGAGRGIPSDADSAHQRRYADSCDGFQGLFPASPSARGGDAGAGRVHFGNRGGSCAGRFHDDGQSARPRHQRQRLFRHRYAAGAPLYAEREFLPDAERRSCDVGRAARDAPSISPRTRKGLL